MSRGTDHVAVDQKRRAHRCARSPRAQPGNGAGGTCTSAPHVESVSCSDCIRSHRGHKGRNAASGHNLGTRREQTCSIPEAIHQPRRRASPRRSAPEVGEYRTFAVCQRAHCETRVHHVSRKRTASRPRTGSPRAAVCRMDAVEAVCLRILGMRWRAIQYAPAGDVGRYADERIGA